MTGWSFAKSRSEYYYKNKIIFNSDVLIDEFIKNEHENKFDAIVLAAEYYLKNEETENINKLLAFLKNSSIPDENFLYLILRKKYEIYNNLNESSSMNEIKASDERSILIYRSIYEMMFKGDNARLTEKIKDLSCYKSGNLYIFCRVIKLKYYLDRLNHPKQKTTYIDYVNLNRILAPFFENKRLKYIYFLDELMPGLPSKLAELNLIDSARLFQKIINTSYNISGQENYQGILSLAYYYTLSNELEKAEEVYREKIGTISEENEHIKNKFQFLLSINLYLQKKYNDSLKELLKINQFNWDANTLNPFNGSRVNLLDLKNISGYILFKAKGDKLAASALNLSDADSSIESNLIQLRTAQILSDKNPELAAKIAEDVIYYSQSRKWREEEYLATLLHGFIQIKLENYFAAIIDFTKSKSIAVKREFEWPRLSGLMRAHILSGKKSPVEKIIPEIYKLYIKGNASDDILQITHYVSENFNSDETVDALLKYYISKKDYIKIFNILLHDATYSYKINHGIYQLSEIERNKGIYFGMKEEAKKYNNLFLSASVEIPKLKDKELLDYELRRIKVPFIAIFAREEKKYLFLVKPKTKNYEIKMYIYANDQDLRNDFINIKNELLKKIDQLQIYYNSYGLELKEYLKGKINLSLFAEFKINATDLKRKNLKFMIPECDKNSPLNTEVMKINKAVVLGRKIVNLEKLYILFLPFTRIDQNEYLLNCSGEKIDLLKLVRRSDIRTVPDSLYLNQELMKSKSGMDYIGFWLNLGVETIYLSNENMVDKGEIAKIQYNITNSYDLKERSLLHDIVIITKRLY